MPDHLSTPSGVRRRGTGRRHGRAPRGPLVLAGPLSPVVRRRRAASREFDDLVLFVVDRLERTWGDQVSRVQFATEDVPVVPADWKDERVPFAASSPATGDEPARVVVFRRPIETRTPHPAERAMLVHDVIVQRLAELWGMEPDDVDP